ncbi:MAG TPA: NAD(P)-binding protein, partial [Mycobacteriales bacterium]|nr:NAD(P)-binding protein [Mycobacteriales bacterium]
RIECSRRGWFLEARLRRTDVLVLGAGPTGLGAAWQLHADGGADWLLVEAAPGPGGAAASVTDPAGFTWDLGGHVIHSHFPLFDDVIARVVDDWSFPRRSGWVSAADPRAWGGGDGWVPTPLQRHIGLLPPPLRDRVVAELADRAVPGDAADGKGPVQIGESLEEFFVAAFGRSLTATFFRPFNTWGHPPAELGHAWTSLRSGSTAPNVPEVDLSLTRPHTPDDTSTFPFPTYGSGAVWSGVARALPADRQVYGDAAAALDSRERVVTLRDGHRIGYELLVSSIPLPTLLALCSETPRPAVDATRLRHSGTHAVGLGFLGQPPPRLRDVSYVYVPDADVPVHRATVLSHYSPAMAGPGRWSLLFEAGCSPRLPVSSADALSSAIEQARRWDAEAAPVSVWQRFLPYGYPVPTLDRDRVLNRVQRWLESVGILSRGRFGGWRYESCNQDYAFMQGVEAVGAVLRGTPERVYWPGRQPAIAGPARACA